jgi:hypothetical protein
MATWLVKIKGFQDAKYIGTKIIKGKEYCVIKWDKYTINMYGFHSYYYREYPMEICTIYRKPGKREERIRRFFKLLFKKDKSY